MRPGGRGRGVNGGLNGGVNGGAVQTPAAGRGRGRGRGSRVITPPDQEQTIPAIGQLSVGGVRERGARANYRQDEPGPSQLAAVKCGPPPGKPVTLLTNYLKLVKSNNLPIFQYHVEISPEIVNERRKTGMMYNGIEELKYKIIFKDQILYTFLDTIGAEKEYHVTSSTKDGEIIHRVTVKRTGEVIKDSPHFANVFFNHVANNISDWQRIRRDYFDPKNVTKLPQYHVEILPGYQFRAGTFASGPLMSIDNKHKVMRTNTALQFIQEIVTKKGGQLQTAQTDIIRELTGRVVITRYNNSTYKIDDVLFDMKASHEIELRPGYKISFIDYYKNKFNLTIHDADQPILLSRKKQRDTNGNDKEIQIHLVPEVCYLTGLSEQESTNTRTPLFKALSNVTRTNPTDKVAVLQTFADTINQEPITERWGLNVETSLLQLQGGNIGAEQVINEKFKIDRGSFDRMTRSRFVISSAGIKDNCHIICNSRDMPLALSMVEQKFAQAAGMDIIFRRENIIQVNSDRAEAFMEAGNSVDTKALLFILPNEKADRYNAIKKRFCVEQPRITQVVLAKTLRNSNGLASKITKILMQIDAKAGGHLWKINLPVKNVMFVGIDTYHDSLSRRRSVGGFVASMNDIQTRYYSRAFWHDNAGEEVFSGLQPIMKDTLLEYYQLNQQFPARIIIFRDGVGYGQMQAVRELEIESIKRAMLELQLQKTEFVFTVVAKRINTRFFEKFGTNYKNPFHGTIVSNGITKNDQAFDFYLVSQSVSQGTVSPTHYTVLEWNTTLKPEHLQQIAFKLCHMYFNWTRIEQFGIRTLQRKTLQRETLRRIDDYNNNKT
ncbi:piwi-like protein 1 [Bolinopsis microptera]|uniref:piwi-like protein 1 n=1 Tax=Bolinopsis microptera TaxID=2820187 RepID=UPI003078B091